MEEGKRQTKTIGKALGDTLGEILVVDAPEQGHACNEFLRTRIKLPYSSRIQTEVKLKYKIKGKQMEDKFKLQYERLPYFCLHCGFMGHDDDGCEKMLMGIPSMSYQHTKLHCSPFKKFEHRSEYVPSPGQPKAKRAMDFLFGNWDCIGTAGSTTKARGVSIIEPAGKIPEEVGSRDGFEEHEKEGESQVDKELAQQVNVLKLNLAKQKPESSRVQGLKRKFEKTQTTPKKPGKKGAGRRAANMQQLGQSLHSEDMIPALRDLSPLAMSYGGSDTSHQGRSQDLI